MSTKTYNIWLNTNSHMIKYNSDVRPCLWIGPCHCFPKRSSPNGLSHLTVRVSKEWSPMIRNESNTMPMSTQWQRVIFECNSEMRPCLCIALRYCYPALSSPDLLPHLAASRSSELQLSVTSWMCIVVWPWLQCQRKFMSADVSCNTFSFDWRNRLPKSFQPVRGLYAF